MEEESEPIKKLKTEGEREEEREEGYMEEDLMEIGLKSIFRAISSLENWIMI